MTPKTFEQWTFEQWQATRERRDDISDLTGGEPTPGYIYFGGWIAIRELSCGVIFESHIGHDEYASYDLVNIERTLWDEWIVPECLDDEATAVPQAYPGHERVARQRAEVAAIKTREAACDWARANLAHLNPANYQDGTWPSWVAAADAAADKHLSSLSRGTAAGNAAYAAFVAHAAIAKAEGR